MSRFTQNREVYVRLLDSTGSDITSTGGAINTVGSSVLSSISIFGTHANVWDNESVGMFGNSASFDCSGVKDMCVFGQSGADGNMTVQVSQNGTDYYSTGDAVLIMTGTAFYLNYTLPSRYCRFTLDTAMTITATLAGK
jgi:hypothetical protein